MNEVKHKLISIVVSAYNEEKVLPLFYAELVKVISPLSKGYDWEIIFVDDGSTDNTAGIIKGFCSEDKRVKRISLSRNFGHQAAITAGLEHSRGDAAVMIDSDLQHPPSLIGKFIEKWELGYDVVSAVREGGIDEGWLKRLTSMGFYKLINSMSKAPIKTAVADFRFMSRKALDAFLRFGEVHRFIRGMVSWMGFKTCDINYVADKRRAGKTKYSYRRMLSFATAGITSFSVVPLRISTIAGFFICIVSLIYAFYVVLCWFIRPEHLQAGWSTMVVLILFMCGMILMSLGIIGEYIGRIYEEVKRRPIYLIQDIEGFN